MHRYFLIFFLFLFPLFGCGRGAAEAESPVPVAGPSAIPAAFDLAQYPAVSVGMEGFLSSSDAVAEVIAKQLGLRLTPINLGEQEIEMLTAMANAGTLPDVLRVDVTSAYFTEWAEKGLLRPWPEDALADYPALAKLMADSDEAQAVRRLFGGERLFLPLARSRSADSGRVYARRDWLDELGVAPPDTLVDYLMMLETFAENDKPGLAAAGGVTYLIALFGADPESWIREGGEWIPAYYSHQMVRGLQFARNLYANGLLDREYGFTKSVAAINKMAGGEAGSLIRQGDGYWLGRFVSVTAELSDAPAQAAWDARMCLLPPPAAPFYTPALTETGEEEIAVEWKRSWPRAVASLGLVSPRTVDDAQFARVCALLAYIASEESREMAYFGLRGETCLPDASGDLRLFVNPATARPYDIVQQYPTARVLFLLGRGATDELDAAIPSELPPGVKRDAARAAALYDAAAIDEGDGFLARFIHTPAGDALKANLDYNAAFNDIVMGGEPVDEMFAVFRAECERQRIRAAIDEVNARIRRADL